MAFIQLTQTVGGWIPVSERLPEYDCNVLVSAYVRRRYVNEYGEVDVDEGHDVFKARLVSYKNKEFLIYDDEWETWDVIAWQPLPEAYEEVK